MTQKVITARLGDGARSVFFRMREHGIRHIPVTDGEGHVIGIISDRDLRRPNWVDESLEIAHVYQLDDSLEVSHLMTDQVQTIRTYDRISKAAALLAEHKFGALPVLNKEGRLAGVLSAQDLLKALDSILNKK